MPANDRQNWRDQNRDDWQNHRDDMWDYRYDRCDEIWGHCGGWYDNCFDDHWWGHCGWGHGWYGCGHYPYNPWWWWAPVTYAAVSGFCSVVASEPVYVDYGMTVVYEGETVYVDNKPMPAAEYSAPIIAMAAEVEQPPPPTPPVVDEATGKEEAKPAEWMPLGIFALAQEKKGDPVALFQLSVNKDGHHQRRLSKHPDRRQTARRRQTGQGHAKRRLARRRKPQHHLHHHRGQSDAGCLHRGDPFQW